jgi:CheY-like chemotaxis protein
MKNLLLDGRPNSMQEESGVSFINNPDSTGSQFSRIGRMGGFALPENASQNEKIPVVALTAYVLIVDRNRALEAGFNDYDIKPVEMPRLLQKMEPLLNNQKVS